MPIMFLIHSQLSWGEKQDYFLANDVEPGLMHRYQTREDWQEVIIDALINVPVAPYLPSNSVIPPISTAKVIGVEAVDIQQANQNILRTRSQFIMAAVWKKQSSQANYNFLHHDYSKWTQRQIKADVDYWCNGHTHPFITLVTKLRRARQRYRLHQETKK
ncbi:hypothetical protein H5S09_08850 [Limosilactobacillus sp. STM2_1]|uniref:Uncharacterized protein n=1 Tax=Limosilactobacillus rudii TaxID=2759755 RepID=A0A7W3YP71_9LACO|nr:hypothetical protein [Limosilactobacillus rudii]MBB1079964.1 hypothetical protein [Limosilactobacillus rudii]MBB1098042.1 hypothetical protein [Limosilactobacillus rudii]MCD7135112.1 hypothetical protein [Limosilactobacillus rudii]